MDFEYDASSYETGNLNAGSSVHDPSIVKDGDKYYIIGSHMTFAYSDDLRKWTLRGNGYSSTNMIFGDLFKDETGLYYMYYCTSSTWNASTLGFATSETIDGKYKYGKDLIYSGLTRYNIEETDVLDYVDKDYALKHYVKLDGTYNFSEYPNALDPAVFYDKDGRMWMVYLPINQQNRIP